jgi:rifampicin phosphotransferase
MIKSLKDIGLECQLEYGGKAACMGELKRQGIRVPSGFALSWNVFAEVLEYNRFPYKRGEYLAFSEEIRAFIMQCVFPPDLIAELGGYFRDLTNQSQENSYIARSSALCEDTGSHSFAGIFETYGNLSSLDDVLHAIKKCYASLFSDKALSYMRRNGWMLENLKMGVIVQEFISGELSGVNFSADTVHMNADVMHINAVKGGCSEYVGGALPSCIYRLDKSSVKVIESHIPEKAPTLNEGHINKLYEITMEIEKLFGGYQDIEWTMRGQELFILQSRPITTFRICNFEVVWSDPQDAECQWFLGPNTPIPPLVRDICRLEEQALDIGVLKTGYSHYYTARCIQNGYIYFRSKELDNRQEIEKDFMVKLYELFEQGKNIFQDVILPELLEIRTILAGYMGRSLTHQEAAGFLDTALVYFKKASELHWPAIHGRKYRRIFEEYCRSILGDMSTEDFYDLVYTPSIATGEREAFIAMAGIVRSEIQLLRLFKDNPHDEIVYHRLKRIPGGEKLLDRINLYLQEFGVCNAGYDGFINPVLWERPEGVVRKIRALIGMDPKIFYDSVNKTKENKKRICDLIEQGLDEDGKTEFLRKLELAEKAFLAGDDHNYYMESSLWGYLRLAVMEAARILTDKGVIGEPEDVFYFTMEEIREVLVGTRISAECVEERKAIFKKQKGLQPPGCIGKEPLKAGQTPLTEGEGGQEDIKQKTILQGISGLCRRVRGKVHIGIPDHLDEECILVIWNGQCGDILHVISRVKGLIFEGGSPFDHLGIIAREMDIPAVYYVKGALQMLKNGNEVELDGLNGQVVLCGKDGLITEKTDYNVQGA